MANDSVSLVVLQHKTVIPWVWCLLAIRVACGVPLLYFAFLSYMYMYAFPFCELLIELASKIPQEAPIAK